MADPSSLPEGVNGLWYLVGGGGISGVLIALIGKWRSKPEPAPQAPSPVQIESPWLVQNIIEDKLTGEAIKANTESILQMLGTMSVQINTIAALLKRPSRRKK